MNKRLFLLISMVAVIAIVAIGLATSISANTKNASQLASQAESQLHSVQKENEAPTSVPVVDPASIKANELGLVPIFEYHIIGDENGRWERSRDTFRQDLQQMYDAGFRSISLNDFIDNKINVPAGYSPVVLTFDDSSPGQFTFIKEGDILKPDPNCAVGILESFYQEHPDFGLNATFYVLPAADPPHNLFGQDEYQQAKLQYLVDKGFEIGNHTYWHQQLTELPDQDILEQIGKANKVITDMVPGYQVRTIALPLGEWPPNQSLAITGYWEGDEYQFDAVMMAGSDPSSPPGSVEYDRFAIPRVQVIDETFPVWMEQLAPGSELRYVSDGNSDTITFPASKSAELNSDAVQGKQVIAY